MGSHYFSMIVLKIIILLSIRMLGKIMTHVRDITVEIFKKKIIYSIPKYLPHECKEYKYKVIDYPNRIEIVAIEEKK